MKIILELHGERYTVETSHEDYGSDELKEIFSRIMVASGFPPTVIDTQEGGRYEYLEEGGIIIKQEETK